MCCVQMKYHVIIKIGDEADVYELTVDYVTKTSAVVNSVL